LSGPTGASQRHPAFRRMRGTAVNRRDVSASTAGRGTGRSVTARDRTTVIWVMRARPFIGRNVAGTVSVNHSLGAILLTTAYISGTRHHWHQDPTGPHAAKRRNQK